METFSLQKFKELNPRETRSFMEEKFYGVICSHEVLDSEVMDLLIYLRDKDFEYHRFTLVVSVARPWMFESLFLQFPEAFVHELTKTSRSTYFSDLFRITHPGWTKTEAQDEYIRGS